MKSLNLSGGWFWLLFGCHLVIASTFIAKYGGRYGLSPSWTASLYCLIAVAGMLIYRGSDLPQIFADRRFLVSAVAVLTALLAILMYQFDPAQIRNARHATIDLAVERILHGEYPYQAPASSAHSAFPGWILLAMPFYLLGDSGLIVLLALPVFAWITWQVDRRLCVPGLMLLFFAPQFLYDIAVRSDIALNLVLCLAVTLISDELISRSQNWSTTLAGVLAGLVLSSRGIVFVAFSAYIGYMSVRAPSQALTFTFSAMLTFIATLAPFAVWDWENFVEWGPIMHQLRLSGLPFWVLGLAFVAPFFIGRLATSFRTLLMSTGATLLLIVALAALNSVVQSGLSTAIMESRFDITYLTIPLPYMIVAMLLLRTRNVAVVNG